MGHQARRGESDVEDAVRRLTHSLAWLTLLLALVALGAAAQANLAIGGPNPPWIGHRWHPVVVTGTIALGLSVVGVVVSGRRLNLVGTAMALALAAVLSLSVGAVTWRHRAFGTRAYFHDAFGKLSLGPLATPLAETYSGGSGGSFRTPGDPRATQTWIVHGPLARTCAELAAAATKWAGAKGADLVVNPSAPVLDCHFSVGYQHFEVTFQHVAGPDRGPWTLEAFMQPA